MNGKEAKAAAAQRVRLFRSAARFTKPERVPYLSAAVTWKVFDAGESLPQALTDFTVMERCNRHFLDTYPVDALLDIGIRNQFNVTEAFGSQGYYYYTEDTVGIRDHAFCTPETLEEYLEDPDRFIWTKVLPEKYGEDWAKKDLSVWKKTYAAYWAYTRFILRMSSVVSSYGLPSMAPNNPMKGAIRFGIEELLANVLGLKQLSLTMRRDPALIEHFCQTWDAQYIDPLVEKVRAGKGPNEKYCFDASVMLLANNFLNPKQFERFYWPSLKKLLDAYAEKGMNVRLFTEGSVLRFADYFKDYPKGTLTFHLEQDDPFAFRAVLPNVAIMGGMTTDLLANASPEACVAHAEKLIRELGEEGGLILSENKMLSYRNDAKSENLAAVCRFVRDYHC